MKKLPLTNLRRLREVRDWTQSFVAKKMGVSRTTITEWENGTNEPKIDNLIKLSNLYEVSIDYILGQTENATKENIDLEIVKILMQLSTYQKQRVFGYVNQLYKETNKISESKGGVINA